MTTTITPAQQATAALRQAAAVLEQAARNIETGQQLADLAALAERDWTYAASFSDMAALLSWDFREAVTRQQVYEWWQRQTKNAARQPFPREERTAHNAPAHRPSRHFSYDKVRAWVQAGVPDRWGDGWRRLRDSQ